MSALTEMTADELIENFELFDDWEDRYAYLIDLGKKLDPMEAALMTEQTKVQGCLSQVWMVAERTEDSPPRLILHADSDAAIVKGVIAVLTVMFSGSTAQEILDLDIDAKLKAIDLESHISPNRRNGLFSMIGKIREFAENSQ